MVSTEERTEEFDVYGACPGCGQSELKLITHAENRSGEQLDIERVSGIRCDMCELRRDLKAKFSGSVPKNERLERQDVEVLFEFSEPLHKELRARNSAM